MTREGILPIAKPILFNTDMVRAILDERKTTTRRIMKGIIPSPFGNRGVYFNAFRKGKWNGPITREQIIEAYAPYKVGDYLYVRETWERFYCSACEGNVRTGKCFNYPDEKDGCYVYKATYEIYGDCKWRPSIHMPKESARIFLRVTGVRVERLQDMDTANDEHFLAEGAKDKHDFIRIWDSTVKRERYGWYINPWVWVIEFGRVQV